MNKQKSNKNAHQLALTKLEKDIAIILKHAMQQTSKSELFTKHTLTKFLEVVGVCKYLYKE